MEFVKNLQSFFQSYNKSLINQACSGPYWENSGPRSFCTDLAALGPYCQDLGPIFSQYGPRAWLIRYIYNNLKVPMRLKRPRSYIWELIFRCVNDTEPIPVPIFITKRTI